MATIRPTEIKGNWVKGFALDVHTVSSDYLGDDQYGHPHFDTKRSPLGELLYRLKFKSDKLVLDDITATLIDFLTNTWKITRTLQFLVPVPPSNLDRAFQPVIEITTRLSADLGLPLTLDSLVKTGETPELKDINDPLERQSVLESVFRIKNTCVKGKNILLLDDLYRSGATLNAATKALYNIGVNNVYVLTLTRTRSKK
ncbi:MAG: ComF family protein [Dehalococcoidia bacterium]|nr:ComF family protein [Dehalococcoidia bacterium]